MQFNTSRSDLVRNISIIEFLFVIVLLVLAHFSYQVEQTNKKENKITLLVLEIKDLKEDIKKLKEKNLKLLQKIKILELQINDPKKLEIFKRNEELEKKISELEAKLKARDEKIASLEKIEDKYEKLKGIDKPNCDIASKNGLTRIVKITLKKGEVFDIEKLWPSNLDSEFNLVPGLNELIGTNISLEQVKKVQFKLGKWPEYKDCRFRMRKDKTQVQELQTKYTDKLEKVIDNMFYQ